MSLSFLVKTNYLHHHSFRLLMGNLLLTLPTPCLVLAALVWDKDLLWIPPILGIIGWILVFPVTYTVDRNSKERIAIDALSIGLLELCLCSAVLSIKHTCVRHTVEPKAIQTLTQKTEVTDPRDGDSNGEFWEHQK